MHISSNAKIKAVKMTAFMATNINPFTIRNIEDSLLQKLFFSTILSAVTLTLLMYILGVNIL